MASDDWKNELLAKLPQMRADYEKLGKLLQAAEAFVADDPYADFPQEFPTAGKSSPGGAIRPDEFFGMNTHDALKAFLAMMGKGNPQSPAEIAKALVAGGQSRDIVKTSANVASGLKRLSEPARNEVVQVRHGQWGLAEWYGANAGKKKVATKGSLPDGNGEAKGGGE
jgi:hypothetical protein